MRESIYILLTTFSDYANDEQIEYVKDSIRKFVPPHGVQIEEVIFSSNRLVESILRMLGEPEPDKTWSNFSTSSSDRKINLVELVLTTETSLRYTRLDWFEQQLKVLIKGIDFDFGVYPFYLKSPDEFYNTMNIGLVASSTKIIVIEDVLEEDISLLDEFARLFNDLWYLQDLTEIEKIHASLLAKHLLLTEDFPLSVLYEQEIRGNNPNNEPQTT